MARIMSDSEFEDASSQPPPSPHMPDILEESDQPRSKEQPESLSASSVEQVKHAIEEPTVVAVDSTSDDDFGDFDDFEEFTAAPPSTTYSHESPSLQPTSTSPTPQPIPQTTASIVDQMQPIIISEETATIPCDEEEEERLAKTVVRTLWF